MREAGAGGSCVAWHFNNHVLTPTWLGMDQSKLPSFVRRLVAEY